MPGFRWISVLFLCFLGLYVHSEGINDEARCELINGASKGWLHVTSARSGLCNQLFGVLGFLPIANLFSLNIIVGNLFSRLSFRQDFHTLSQTAQPMPFSHFFDWDHYRDAAKANHSQINQVVQEIDVNDACGAHFLGNRTLFVPKRFWPFSRKGLFEVLDTQNVTLPRPAGSVMRLGDDLITTFQFNNPDNTPRSYLDQQFESLSRLNATLQFIYETIIQRLPSDYLAVHVRLEHDVLGTHEAEKNHTHFNLLVHGYLDEVEAVYAKGHPETGGPIPHHQRIVYMSTGLFHNFQLHQHGNHSGHFRPNAVMRIFTAAGYTPLWSDRVLALPGSSPEQTQRGAKARELLEALGAEQKALVDLFVCKHAGGFVGSKPFGSSFTYLIWRWREYELRIPKSEMEVIMSKEASRGFESWGIRRKRARRQ